MRHSSLLSLLCGPYAAASQMTGKLGDAMAIMNNPPGATYNAMLKGGPVSMAMGEVTAMSGPGGRGVMFNLTLMGLPMTGGPYSKSMSKTLSLSLSHLVPFSLYDVRRFNGSDTQRKMRTHARRLSYPRSARGHERRLRQHPGASGPLPTWPRHRMRHDHARYMRGWRSVWEAWEDRGHVVG